MAYKMKGFSGFKDSPLKKQDVFKVSYATGKKTKVSLEEGAKISNHPDDKHYTEVTGEDRVKILPLLDEVKSMGPDQYRKVLKKAKKQAALDKIKANK